MNGTINNNEYPVNTRSLLALSHVEFPIIFYFFCFFPSCSVSSLLLLIHWIKSGKHTQKSSDEHASTLTHRVCVIKNTRFIFIDIWYIVTTCLWLYIAHKWHLRIWYEANRSGLPCIHTGAHVKFHSWNETERNLRKGKINHSTMKFDTLF